MSSELLSEIERRSSLVCQAEGKERRKATSGAQGTEEVLLVGMGRPPAAGPAAAPLPARRPSSSPSPPISCRACTTSTSTTAACTAM